METKKTVEERWYAARVVQSLNGNVEAREELARYVKRRMPVLFGKIAIVALIGIGVVVSGCIVIWAAFGGKWNIAAGCIGLVFASHWIPARAILIDGSAECTRLQDLCEHLKRLERKAAG